MKIYISGGIHGYPPEVQEKFFREQAERLQIRGWDAVVPHDIPAYHPNPETRCPRSYASGNGHSAACWLRGDLIEMLKCDAVVMVGEWERSVGAALVEHHTACAAGIPIYYGMECVPDLKEIPA